MNPGRRTLWFAMVALAIGATMLHVRIHPPSKGATYFLANSFAAADLLLVSTLFLSRRTAVWALLLNSFIAFLGIILMADFSLVATITGKLKVSPATDPFGWFLKTTFPDIAIAFADFLIGLSLYRVTIREQPVHVKFEHGLSARQPEMGR